MAAYAMECDRRPGKDHCLCSMQIGDYSLAGDSKLQKIWLAPVEEAGAVQEGRYLPGFGVAGWHQLRRGLVEGPHVPEIGQESPMAGQCLSHVTILISCKSSWGHEKKCSQPNAQLGIPKEGKNEDEWLHHWTVWLEHADMHHNMCLAAVRHLKWESNFFDDYADHECEGSLPEGDHAPETWMDIPRHNRLVPPVIVNGPARTGLDVSMCPSCSVH